MPLYYYYQSIATCKQGPSGQYWNSSSETALFVIKTNLRYNKRFYERKDRFGWITEFWMVELSLSVHKNVMILQVFQFALIEKISFLITTSNNILHIFIAKKKSKHVFILKKKNRHRDHLLYEGQLYIILYLLITLVILINCETMIWKDFSFIVALRTVYCMCQFKILHSIRLVLCFECFVFLL